MKIYPKLSILFYLGLSLFENTPSWTTPKGRIQIHMAPYVYSDNKNPRYGVIFYDNSGGIFHAEEGAAQLGEDGTFGINLGALEKKVDCMNCHEIELMPENLLNSEGREYRRFVHK